VLGLIELPQFAEMRSDTQQKTDENPHRSPKVHSEPHEHDEEYHDTQGGPEP
jgi:hypothetical protein